MFVTGGLTGIMFIAIPFDQQVTDTYFVIAHFHYIIFGAAVFPIFGGLYYWFPKVTGRMYFELPGQISFWLIFAGTNLLFFPMHIVGLLGMPRRIYTYPSGLGWTSYNVAETIGGYLTRPGSSSAREPRPGATAAARSPGPTLARADARVDDELAAPDYDFPVIPTVTSAYPNWDVDDRELDRRNLAAGVFMLDRGHEQLEVTPVDGRFSEVVQMPHESPWPVLLAGAVSLSS